MSYPHETDGDELYFDRPDQQADDAPLCRAHLSPRRDDEQPPVCVKAFEREMYPCDFADRQADGDLRLVDHAGEDENDQADGGTYASESFGITNVGNSPSYREAMIDAGRGHLLP